MKYKYDILVVDLFIITIRHMRVYKDKYNKQEGNV